MDVLFEKRKKHKTISIGIIVCIFALTFSGGFFLSGCQQKASVKELHLHGLSAEYSGWTEEKGNDSDSIIIEKGSLYIAFFYVQSDVFTNTFSLAHTVIDSHKSAVDSFNLLKNVEETTINGNNWSKYEFSYILEGKKMKVLELVLSTDYEYYFIRYVASENVHDDNINAVNIILETIKVKTKELNSPDIKQKLLGEWNCGEAGYLVVNDDNTYYLFRDSSKSMDNVFYGTYECSTGIPTAAAGYAEGISFIGNIELAVLDGETIAMNEGSKLMYAFSPNGTDENAYDGFNLNTTDSFIMKK